MGGFTTSSSVAVRMASDFPRQRTVESQYIGNETRAHIEGGTEQCECVRGGTRTLKGYHPTVFPRSQTVTVRQLICGSQIDRRLGRKGGPKQRQQSSIAGSSGQSAGMPWTTSELPVAFFVLHTDLPSGQTSALPVASEAPYLAPLVSSVSTEIASTARGSRRTSDLESSSRRYDAPFSQLQSTSRVYFSCSSMLFINRLERQSDMLTG
ncbi:hypothetical protein BJ546DRAFT_182896 [Cryomyces antarcticus]